MAAVHRLLGPRLESIKVHAGYVPFLPRLVNLEVCQSCHLCLPAQLPLTPWLLQVLTIELLYGAPRLDVTPLQVLPHLATLNLEGAGGELVRGVDSLTQLERLTCEECFLDPPLLPASLTSLLLHALCGDAYDLPVAAALQAFGGRWRDLDLGIYLLQLGNDLERLCALPGVSGVRDLCLKMETGCAEHLCRPCLPELRFLTLELSDWSGEQRPNWDLSQRTRLHTVTFDVGSAQALDLRGMAGVRTRKLVFEFAVYGKDYRLAADFSGWQVSSIQISHSWGIWHQEESVPRGTPLCVSDTLGAVLVGLPDVPHVTVNDKVLDNFGCWSDEED